MTTDIKVLSDLVVVDLGVGMAAALVSKFLGELGARVIRVEPPQGDPFARHYPAHEIWRRGAQRDDAASQSTAHLEQLLASADVCICGGEDHPDIERRADVADMTKRHARLVVLNIEGYPNEFHDAPAADVL